MRETGPQEVTDHYVSINQEQFQVYSALWETSPKLNMKAKICQSGKLLQESGKLDWELPRTMFKERKSKKS